MSSGELAATAPTGPREPLPGELQRLLPTPFVPLLIRGLAPPTARCWPAPACSRIQGDDLPFPTPVRSILTSPAILLRPGFLSGDSPTGSRCIVVPPFPSNFIPQIFFLDFPFRYGRFANGLDHFSWQNV